MDNSGLDLRQSISQQLGTHEFQFQALPGDASFRTYFRIDQGSNSYIAMLAPPTKERTDEFVRIAKIWHRDGLLVPEIFAWERNQGFVLLSDFGDTLLLQRLSAETVEGFYQRAMNSIIHLQATCPIEAKLPPYDAAYASTELSYFAQWFINKLLGLTFSPHQEQLWQQAMKLIIECFCQQPQVTVHRDYHSRNLMVLPDAQLGIIDFQDAMVGPITYDLVSLLKDCYITWPALDIERWLGDFFHNLKNQNAIEAITFPQFKQWFDWVGLQRHLKVLGIFSRLNLRDNKPHYLKHLPRVMAYVLAITNQYAVFSEFNEYLQAQVLPKLLMILENQNISCETEVKVA